MTAHLAPAQAEHAPPLVIHIDDIEAAVDDLHANACLVENRIEPVALDLGGHLADLALVDFEIQLAVQHNQQNDGQPHGREQRHAHRIADQLPKVLVARRSVRQWRRKGDQQSQRAERRWPAPRDQSTPNGHQATPLPARSAPTDAAAGHRHCRAPTPARCTQRSRRARCRTVRERRTPPAGTAAWA